MTQRTLFDNPRPAPRQPGPPDEDRERLGRLQGKVLERLQRGPAQSGELARITHRFGARIEELRKAGHTIDARRVAGGAWLYELREDGDA